MSSRVALLCVFIVGCGPTPMARDAGGESTSDAGVGDVVDASVALDAGRSADAGGTTDAGATDAGAPITVVVQASLFWSDAGVVDDPAVVSFAKLMRLASHDDHGGRLLSDWFHRFATTPHSERALPAQFIDEVARSQGADATQWDLSRLPFVITGIHNRIDLALLEAGGHCGEFRVSAASTDATLQPFHMLFLFRQPLEPDDTVDRRVTCEGTARRWARLSTLSGAALDAELRSTFAQRLTREHFLLIETVEQSLSPWEWRQWVKTPSTSGLPFVFENPPLFQQLDVERLNVAGPLRTDFLSWVTTNAALAASRQLPIADRFRPQSIRAALGVPRQVLSLTGLDAQVQSQYPQLRQQLEVIGCAACHMSDADFVQTRADRTISPFYAKELDARARHLEQLARGDAPTAPFGPLQPMPVLPP
ncbi:MAG: hypothetical protein Q8N26_22905 [Myxococcales bacterium]|nr:hypothetical protein [Myxococcales bacterium]